MDQGLPALAGALHQVSHVPEVGLSQDGLPEISGAGATEAVPVLGGVEDALLLGGVHHAVVDVKGDPAALPQAAEQGQLLGGGGVLPEGPDAPEGVSAEIVVGAELDDPRGDAVQEVLQGRLLFPRDGGPFLLLFGLTHGPEIPLLPCSKRVPW